jgi:O-methyltransferase involved in polyketide biosynthesis
VPVDFEAGDAWWDRLVAAGFDPQQPAVVASPGAGLNLPKDALLTTLRQIASLAPGSMLVVSFLLPIEMLTVAREAGFKHVQHVSAAALGDRYFAGRADDLRPPTNSEELLVAIT